MGDNGADEIHGDAGNDNLAGAGGPDTINGGTGNDRMDEGDTPGDPNGIKPAGPLASDTIRGGAGTDTATYCTRYYPGSDGRKHPLTITLDNKANDGEKGEKDNIGPTGDVENVLGGGVTAGQDHRQREGERADRRLHHHGHRIRQQQALRRQRRRQARRRQRERPAERRQGRGPLPRQRGRRHDPGQGRRARQVDQLRRLRREVEQGRRDRGPVRPDRVQLRQGAALS